MSFNDKASTNGGIGVSPCYGERLALAVPKNKKILEKYVDGLTGLGKALNSFFLYKSSGVFLAYYRRSPSRIIIIINKSSRETSGLSGKQS